MKNKIKTFEYKMAVPELREFSNRTLAYNVCGFKVLSETKLN